LDGGDNQEKDVLHLGCGHNLAAGAVNVDVRANVGADVVHDLNQRPWPFPDNRFGAVIATHVIEHLHDTVATMEEIHRVCRHGATVKIVTPHFSSPNAFTDPTHCRYFGYYSFQFFTGEQPNALGDPPRFRRRKTWLVFASTRIRILEGVGARLAKWNPQRYEHRFSVFFPAEELHNELEVVKDHAQASRDGGAHRADAVQAPMKRILILASKLEPWGGGEGALAWIIEALKRDYRLTVLAWTPPDLDGLNRFFATDLCVSDAEFLVMNPLVGAVAQRAPVRMTRLKDQYLWMRSRRIADRFDAVLSGHNEADVGDSGIQYIHSPKNRGNPSGADAYWWLAPATRAYRAMIDRWTGVSLERMRKNLTLANSDFTGRKVRELLGIDTITLYPPAIGEFPDVPWERRKDGFVCIGRIIPCKQIELIIEILSAVRAAGPQVHLHVVGKADSAAYAASIRRVAQDRASWVHLHEGISRPELVELISNHRYGIHAMDEEPFGMAVAELVSAGCITFVPNSGGQVEIVGNDERLIYNSRQDAVNKILRALGDNESEYQASLRSHIESRRNLFATERFVTRIREVVGDYLRQRQVGPVRVGSR
jgi:glycosyltransferase involved in cell wall biosynthesis